MMELIALKKLRYPRAQNGSEYAKGDRFWALSERDAKLLIGSGIAQSAPKERSVPKSAPQSAEVASEPGVVFEPRQDTFAVRDMAAENGESSPSSPRRYRRRDMQPEE